MMETSSDRKIMGKLRSSRKDAEVLADSIRWD
jgi:hypothetical protein